MTARRDILDEGGDSLKRPMVVSAVLHGALFATFFVIAAVGSTHKDQFGDPNGGGYGVPIQPVASINLPPRSGPKNLVANDSESEIPQKVQKVEKKAPEPDDDAVALPSNKKDKKARERDTRALAKNDVPERPNQVYSNVPQSVSSPMYGGQTGGGGVGIGNANPLGTRFGWYAQILRDRVQQHWRVEQIDPRLSGAPAAVVTFSIMRDGSVRNVKIGQSSGNYGVDASAQRAILESAPFPPLPAGFERSQADIEFWFRFKR
jgi:TonB family protein